MKQLILCRHSKPESSDLPKPDRDRKLTAKGKQDARAIGKEIAKRGCTPDLVLSSDSIRTRQTTALICEAFPIKPEIAFLPELYSAPGGEVMNIVASYAAQARAILVIGHNPGMEELVSRMAGEDLRLGTSTVAVFETDGERGSENDPPAGLCLKEVFGPPA